MTEPGDEQEPPRHPGRHRGVHAAPPSPLRLLIRSLFAVAIVGGLVALLVNLRGSPTTTSTLEPPNNPGPAIVSPSPAMSTPTAPTTAARRVTPTAAPTVAPTQAVRTASPTPTRVVAPLFVANNTREKGKAHRAAARFQSGGWPISGTGNYRSRRISETTVYYAPGNATEKAAAESLRRQFPQVRGVAPRFAGLPGHGLVVVLTADFPA